MELNWKLLSNAQKFKRTVFLGVLSIASCVIWSDDILLWPRGKGPIFIIVCVVGFPLQALFFGFKSYKERERNK